MCVVSRKGENQEKYIPTPEAARLFGLQRNYAARLARRAFDRGDRFPVKRGRSFEAPASEWERIFKTELKTIRKPRPEIDKPPFENTDPDPGISCSRAARKYGISPSWAARLSKRSQDRGDQWPKWEGGQLIAPYPEWVRLFEDQTLRNRKNAN